MHVFVTGATGWIGSAVVPELLAAGHTVTGLARTKERAAALSAAGAAAHAGSLDDLDSLRAGAEAADAVVHLAFKHDFSDYVGAGRTERAAVGAFGDVLAGSDRPLLIAAGAAGLVADGRAATEDDRPAASGPDAPRGDSEGLVLELADRGIRSVSVRFAPSVHGEGDHGFIKTLVEVARDRATAGYVGDGGNRWAAVHRSDAARLVRLALEGSPAGSVVHAVAEEGITTHDLAAAMGRGLDVPTTSIEPDSAMEHFGWIGRFWALDMLVSSAITRERLGWEPTGPTLLEDLAGASYFAR